jgi:hypothetical protein
LEKGCSHSTSLAAYPTWEVRTLRVKEEEDGPWCGRTPAMAAGLADHVWSLEEWLRLPAKPRLPV